MGEVWRAHDPRLGRDVAVKTSFEKFSDRFEREARAIAALNHPNICTLYDVGPDYLVMELVEGPTLADRLARGPIPLDEALAIAKQIADALEAAHEKNIVHRDLKPANIKLRPDGSVKVLDFGLAKPTEEEAHFGPESPTTLSRTGIILGTAAYMSPEQARGRRVDKRADIWAFGVVLYEMVTGQPLFTAATLTDTLAAVLTKEPEFRALPAKVRRLLQRCLERDPKARLRDIGDHSALLDDQFNPAPRPSLLPWALAATLAIALAGVTWFVATRPAPIPRVTRFQIFAPPGSTLPIGTPAPSPDGRMIAYTVLGKDGVRRIHVRPLNSTESRALPGTDNAQHKFWSPDSQSLAFAADGSLKRIDLSGGSPVVLAPIASPWHGSWNQFGEILFQSPVFVTDIIPASGGAGRSAMRLDKSKGETGSGFPFFLPDGKRFLIRIDHGDGSGSIELQNLGSGERKIVLPNVFSAPIVGAGPRGKAWLFYLRDTSLMAQEFDEKSGSVRGSAFVLVDSIGRVAAGQGAPSFGISSTGILAWQSATAIEAGRLAWFDRSGKLLNELPADAGGGEPSLSPDGRFAAVSKTSAEGSSIWLVDFTRGSATRFTFGAGRDTNPVWSPDGKRVGFLRLRNTWGMYVKTTDGIGQEELVKAGITNAQDWSPNGRQILFSDLAGRLFVLPLADGTVAKTPIEIGPQGGLVRSARISPDNRYIALDCNESGRFEIYVEPMPPSTGKWQISVNGGRSPRWRKDGKELFFMGPDRKIMAVDFDSSQGIKAGVPHALSLTIPDASALTLDVVERQYDVSADGRRFLIYSPPASNDNPITVVENWWADLKDGSGR